MSFTLEERRDYCGNEHVRARILEFFGEAAHDERPAVFLAAGTENGSRHREALPVQELTSWLDRGAELNRSLWDRESLVCHLDLEYVNFDDPAYPFLNAARIFALQEPVVAAAEELLAGCGIRPLKMMTGRGYHLVWRIGRTSGACTELAELGHVSPSLKRLYSTERAPTGEHVTPELGRAFAGLGLVMEFVAQEIKARAAPHCEVPVELGAIETDGGPHGREMISVDITEYADPLCSRVMRAPFSVYLKPAQQRFNIGDDLAGRLPPLVIIPLGDLSVPEALATRQNPAAAARLAETSWTAIPDASRAMKRLIRTYRTSRLARFHAEFYSQEHDAPGLWPETYDLTPLDALPPCARVILERPNDLLLRPACAQKLVRVMLALGWHPRHIAGLIRSKYERDHGWGDQWRGYDPATRADFYARVFAGLFIANGDDLTDFNCQSARQEGLCPIENCTENLLTFRMSLLDRRKYERLACRPFNRLFLPEEHL
ncbi:MAG: hypothetical protein K8R23_15065 [Chthoniobacter sp.]|nr:hypothetical protein [Chthoniobacter sp.]